MTNTAEGEPTKGLRLVFEPGICGLKFVAGEGKYPEDNGPTDMAYINSLIETDERCRDKSETNLAAQLRAMGTSNVVPDMEQMDSLLISAANEIERLKHRLKDQNVVCRNQHSEIELLRAALKVAQQAILEFNHAQECGPSWYTRGANGMYQQVRLWLQRGSQAVQGALGPYDDNGQYEKEKPAGEQEGVLTITRDVTTVSPNFRMTVKVSEPGEPRKPMLTDRADELIRELHRQGLVTMRSVFDGAILTILPDRPAMEDASQEAARGPCSLCGRTDSHTHAAGPFGMS